MKDYIHMYTTLNALAVKVIGIDNDAYYGYRKVADYIYSCHVRNHSIHR